jgi:hypothetical protein
LIHINFVPQLFAFLGGFSQKDGKTVEQEELNYRGTEEGPATS